MAKYIVTVSFAGPEVGSHAAGDEIELTAEEAKALAPFIRPVGKQPKIETAEAVPADVETADVKSPRSKKG